MLLFTTSFAGAGSFTTDMDPANNLMQEQLGLAKIHEICARISAVWRPTTSVDIGIDGQLEFLEPDSIVGTGKIVAIQVKSGPSYFKNQTSDQVPYYPTERHKRYWKQIQLPVLLVLHDAENGRTYYEYVKPQLDLGNVIRVSKNNILSPDSREELLSGYDRNHIFFNRTFDAMKVLTEFSRIAVTINCTARFTGIHFLLSCFNHDQRIFELRQTRLSEVMHAISAGQGVTIGSGYYDMLLRCVMKCWANALTEPFEEDFEKSWYDLEMVPDILVPSTVRGQTLIGNLFDQADVYIRDEQVHKGTASPEAYARWLSTIAQSASDYLDLSDRLPREPR